MTNNSSTARKIAFALIGAGGFAREVMPLLQNHITINEQSNPETKYEVYFVETTPLQTEVNGYPLISEETFLELECSERFFNIAIADSKARECIANKWIARGAKPISIRSAHAVIYDKNEIGEGAIFCAHTIVTSNAKIGKFFHSNIYSYVAHDCIIGDYVTFAPNVHCNGNVHIHNHAYIGTGAVIRQGTSSKPLLIGEGAVIGMGAVVTKDVPAFTTVVGNPAAILKKK